MRASPERKQRNQHDEETARRQKPRPAGGAGSLCQQRRFCGNAIIHTQTSMFSVTYYDTAASGICISM
jgi:hypothetical protein